MDNGLTSLNAEERAIFIEVIEPTLFIRDQKQFCQWARTELQRIFPHSGLVCGMGRIGKDGVSVRYIMGYNFPQAYLKTLQRPDGLISSPMLDLWVKKRQPVLFETGAGAHLSELEWRNNFRRFGLTNLAAHGQCDIDSLNASCFKFSGIPGPLTQRHAYLLKLLVPYLHVMLVRVVSDCHVGTDKPDPQLQNLTAREKEILAWMADGKTNWEIAQVLRISEATVKNHVHHILARLDASSRAQAVAKAMDLKLIHNKLALLLYAGAGLLQQGLELQAENCFPPL